MASCVWVCDLVPHGPVPEARAPRVYKLWLDLPEPRPTIFSVTTSARASSPRAMGILLGVTAAQITSLNSQSNTWARQLPANWRTLTWGNVPAAQRTRAINAVGGSPNILTTDSLPTALRKLLASMEDASGSLDDLLTRAGDQL